MRLWLEACESDHVDCRPKTTCLPTRLIDVGFESGSSPRLVYSNELKTKPVRYAALSYCWGDKVPIRTMRATESKLQKAVPYSGLPSTFQDAVDIARALHIPFLWIDALCIVQDNPEDWEREAARMQHVYSGSTLTIAASGAQDTSEGFFAHEAPRFRSASVPAERILLRVDSFANRKPMIIQIRDQGGLHEGMSPILQTRGWTLQETVLSSRVVQCVQSELYWRCSCGCLTESGLSLSATTHTSCNTPALGLTKIQDSYKLWWRLMEDYSGRAFTFRKDRLPAIAGLINNFESATFDEPCLGMWVRTLHEDLAWMRVETLEIVDDELNFPSWTWLSCPVGIIFDPAAANVPMELRKTPDTATYHVEIVDWHVSWQGRPFTSKLESTSLLIDGPLLHLYIEVPLEAKDFKPPYCVINHQLTKDPSHPIPWRSTVQFDRELCTSAQTWTCLLLRSASYNDEEEERKDYVFLMLEPVRSDAEYETFRRVGLAIARDDDDAFKTATHRTIHLV